MAGGSALRAGQEQAKAARKAALASPAIPARSFAGFTFQQGRFSCAPFFFKIKAPPAEGQSLKFTPCFRTRGAT